MSGPKEVSDEEGVRVRVEVMVIIFVVSLFASSFPSVSKRVKFLRIPKIVFFIGKHFGTGVILSTAFVHLLQDAFSSLQDPNVEARYHLRHWTGLIVLGSLLSIFFVEYISTSYVDRLHSFNSLPSSPEPSLSPSLSHNYHSELSSPPTTSNSHIHDAIDSLLKTNPEENSIATATEQTPLIPNSPSTQPEMLNTRHAQSFSYGSRSPNQPLLAGSLFYGHHHHHESRGKLENHRNRSLLTSVPVIYVPEDAGKLTEIQASAHDRGRGHNHDSEALRTTSQECEAGDELAHEEVKVGKKRQVVGILILQLGIMLHSLVIGLTLAITSGSEFTSLVTAIIFHQLFEGLSLGIRIAGLPSSKKERGCCGSFSLLKTTLMILFAITTPVGIFAGLLYFTRGTDAQMKFTQGLMCAISAGMLIYAACVEMLAGDFVMDTTLWRCPVWKQAVALVSLLIGAAAMAVIGSWH
ncbi:hypothetical protein PILCRDRAFT_814564 [Piloderma croceum F 1598]|uniref:Zinc/iron permease n=1 Tax=Piloderma croceum (strain F 1598) TaxID=765440 RepID=A0A0C3BMZ5_PILCF|nr:hypothetical protein PILCRDRAFT_814564 [Piloderma croceum F 1598]